MVLRTLVSCGWRGRDQHVHKRFPPRSAWCVIWPSFLPQRIRVPAHPCWQSPPFLVLFLQGLLHVPDAVGRQRVSLIMPCMGSRESGMWPWSVRSPPQSLSQSLSVFCQFSVKSLSKICQVSIISSQFSSVGSVVSFSQFGWYRSARLQASRVAGGEEGGQREGMAVDFELQ